MASIPASILALAAQKPGLVKTTPLTEHQLGEGKPAVKQPAAAKPAVKPALAEPVLKPAASKPAATVKSAVKPAVEPEAKASTKSVSKTAGKDAWLKDPKLIALAKKATAPKKASVAKKVAPVAKKDAPTAKKVAPVAKKVAPVAKKDAPTAKKVAPVAKKVSPVAKKDASAAKKVAPVAKKAVPVAKKHAPVATKTAPVAKQTAAKPLQNLQAASLQENNFKIEAPLPHLAAFHLKAHKSQAAIDMEKLAAKHGININQVEAAAHAKIVAKLAKKAASPEINSQKASVTNNEMGQGVLDKAPQLEKKSPTSLKVVEKVEKNPDVARQLALLRNLEATPKQKQQPLGEALHAEASKNEREFSLESLDADHDTATFKVNHDASGAMDKMWPFGKPTLDTYETEAKQADDQVGYTFAHVIDLVEEGETSNGFTADRQISDKNQDAADEKTEGEDPEDDQMGSHMKSDETEHGDLGEGMEMKSEHLAPNHKKGYTPDTPTATGHYDPIADLLKANGWSKSQLYHTPTGASGAGQGEHPVAVQTGATTGASEVQPVNGQQQQQHNVESEGESDEDDEDQEDLGESDDIAVYKSPPPNPAEHIGSSDRKPVPHTGPNPNAPKAINPDKATDPKPVLITKPPTGHLMGASAKKVLAKHPEAHAPAHAPVEVKTHKAIPAAKKTAPAEFGESAAMDEMDAGMDEMPNDPDTRY